MTATTRVPGLLGALLLALLALLATAATAGVAGADDTGGRVAHVVTFTGHAYLMPGPPGQPGRFTLVSDTCQVKSDGEAPVPCRLVLAGTFSPAGGKARGAVTSAAGVISLDESFVFTGPGTAFGSGPAIDVDRADGSVTFGSFTASFVTTPTSTPNVVLDDGTVIVREPTT